MIRNVDGLTAAQRQIVDSNPTWEFESLRLRDDVFTCLIFTDAAIYIGRGISVPKAFDDAYQRLQNNEPFIAIDDAIGDLHAGERVRNPGRSRA